jgi:hypothetical protein
MGGVNDQDVDAGVAQGMGTRLEIGAWAHRRGTQQAPAAVTRRVWIGLDELQVFDRDESGQPRRVGDVDEGDTDDDRRSAVDQTQYWASSKCNERPANSRASPRQTISPKTTPTASRTIPIG